MSAGSKSSDGLDDATCTIMETSMLEEEGYFDPAEGSGAGLSGAEGKKRLESLCRVCANASDYFIPVFEGEGAEHQLDMKIQKHLPIRVLETDGLPAQVCYQCASTLIAWHDLVTACVEADKKLHQLLLEEEDDDYADRDEKVVEFFNEPPVDSDGEDFSEPSTSAAVVETKECLPPQKKRTSGKGKQQRKAQRASNALPESDAKSNTALSGGKETGGGQKGAVDSALSTERLEETNSYNDASTTAETVSVWLITESETEQFLCDVMMDTDHSIPLEHDNCLDKEMVQLCAPVDRTMSEDVRLKSCIVLVEDYFKSRKNKIWNNRSRVASNEFVRRQDFVDADVDGSSSLLSKDGISIANSVAGPSYSVRGETVVKLKRRAFDWKRKAETVIGTTYENVDVENVDSHSFEDPKGTSNRKISKTTPIETEARGMEKFISEIEATPDKNSVCRANYNCIRNKIVSRKVELAYSETGHIKKVGSNVRDNLIEGEMKGTHDKTVVSHEVHVETDFTVENPETESNTKVNAAVQKEHKNSMVNKRTSQKRVLERDKARNWKTKKRKVMHQDINLNNKELCSSEKQANKEEIKLDLASVTKKTETFQPPVVLSSNSPENSNKDHNSATSSGIVQGLVVSQPKCKTLPVQQIREKNDKTGEGVGFFACSICFSHFRIKPLLRDHYKSRHNIEGEEVFKCKQCGRVYKTTNWLTRHVLAHFEPHKCYLSCAFTFCAVELKSRVDYCAHLEKHFPYLVMSCMKDREKLACLNELGHGNSKRFECAYCGTSFRFSVDLKKHISKNFNVVKPWGQPFSRIKQNTLCDICVVDYVSPGAFMKHLASNKLCRKNYECNLCDKLFTDVSNLKRHKREVHGEDMKFCCPKCGKYFARKRRLELHLEIHYSCDSCGKMFHRKSNLRAHIRTHISDQGNLIKLHNLNQDSGAKKRVFRQGFTCDTCGKKFDRILHLSNHMKVHTSNLELPTENTATRNAKRNAKHNATRNAKRNAKRNATHKAKLIAKRNAKHNTKHSAKHTINHTIKKPFECKDCISCFEFLGSLLRHRLDEHETGK